MNTTKNNRPSPDLKRTPVPWTFYPWLLGLLVAPLLFGCVKPEGQAVVGILFALSILGLFQRLGGVVTPVVPRWFQWALVALLIIPVIPLPIGLVAVLSPAQAALAREFPVDSATAPRWLALATSPAGTIQRLWELSLIASCFCLARYCATKRGFARLFVWTIGLGAGLEAASDVWYRMDGRRALLGIWKISWGVAAGTFANRNHFADWLCVAAVFVAGWVLRNLRPLHGARPGAQTPAVKHPADAVLLGVISFFGVGMAVACGSRGGMIALLAGAVVWIIILAQRSYSRTRWLVSGVFAIAVLALILFAGDLLFQRFGEAQLDLAGRYPKTEIWHQSWQLFLRFPLFGTGWGTFVTAFNHFKTMGGNNTFWHAENDYLQLLVETGILGALAFGFLICRLAWMAGKLVWSLSAKMEEPELVFGAVAALAAFAVHAVFEFVFQVTATALLAAALCGFVIGWRDRLLRPAVAALPAAPRMTANLLWALMLGAVAVLQGTAFLHWQSAVTKAEKKINDGEVAKLEQSLRLWPWSVNRQIALTRVRVQLLADRERADRLAVLGENLASVKRQELLREVRSAQLKAASETREELNRSIAFAPLDWELRLERAWLDIAFSTNSVQALDEAREVVRLNPLQGQIPLRFARHYVNWDPAAAADFLLAASASGNGPQMDILKVAWQLKHDTSALWDLTPDTANGLMTLGEFALGNGLQPLAAQAFQRLSNRVDNAVLAAKLLDAKRPDLAVAMLPAVPNSNRERLVLAEAAYQNEDYPQAIRYAESVWFNHPDGKAIIAVSPGPASLDQLFSDWKANPANRQSALRLADKVFQQPASQRDMATLDVLSDKFPAELHLAWLVYRAELEQHHFHEAAGKALYLARRLR